MQDFDGVDHTDTGELSCIEKLHGPNRPTTVSNYAVEMGIAIVSCFPIAIILKFSVAYNAFPHSAYTFFPVVLIALVSHCILLSFGKKRR
jgi:hypothetical protein